jgi:hypothetical protein
MAQPKTCSKQVIKVVLVIYFYSCLNETAMTHHLLILVNAAKLYLTELIHFVSQLPVHISLK